MKLILTLVIAAASLFGLPSCSTTDTPTATVQKAEVVGSLVDSLATSGKLSDADAARIKSAVAIAANYATGNQREAATQAARSIVSELVKSGQLKPEHAAGIDVALILFGASASASSAG